MSTKNENMVNKNVVIALGIIVMVLFSGIIVVFAYYSTAVTQRDNIIAMKEQEVLSLQNEVTDLEEQLTDLQDEVEAQQNQILSLQNQLGSTAASVINVGLGARDDRSNPSDPFLYVSGYVCNIGTESAYNVRLHVTAYRGSVEVINSYYEVADSLGRLDSRHVEARFYYSGPELTYNSWTMTPECTSTP
jgi:Na+-transporting NADH:ubiquinone oxidoreductase subunit NqrC